MLIATTLKTYMEYMENDDLDKALSMIKSDGFSACGIVLEKSLEHYLSIVEKLKNSGLKWCIHAPITDLNIASINDGIRKESVKQVKDAIILAKELDAVVDFHPGSFRNKFKVDEAYEAMEISILDLLSFAEQNNVKIVLENMEPGDNKLCVTLIQLSRVLEKFKNLDICMDIAHVAMYTEEFMQFWIELNPRVKSIHISGVNGRNSHVEVSLKESLVDFTPFIQAAKDFDGIMRIENRTREKTLESFEFIKNALNK